MITIDFYPWAVLQIKNGFFTRCHFTAESLTLALKLGCFFYFDTGYRLGSPGPTMMQSIDTDACEKNYCDDRDQGVPPFCSHRRLKCPEEHDFLSTQTLFGIIYKLICDDFISGGASLPFIECADMHKNGCAGAAWGNEAKSPVILPGCDFPLMAQL